MRVELKRGVMKGLVGRLKTAAQPIAGKRAPAPSAEAGQALIGRDGFGIDCQAECRWCGCLLRLPLVRMLIASATRPDVGVLSWILPEGCRSALARELARSGSKPGASLESDTTQL